MPASRQPRERYRLDPDQSLDALGNLSRNRELTLFAAAETLLAGSFETAVVQQCVWETSDPGGLSAD